MVFGGFVNLTSSFNSLIHAAGHTSALGMGGNVLRGLASDDNDKKDGVERTMKAVAKMSLLGMLL